MAEYHVGCGMFGIYAGTFKKTLSKKAQEQGWRGEWQDKSEVTQEAIDAVIQYLYENNKEVHFTLKDGKYTLAILKDER